MGRGALIAELQRNGQMTAKITTPAHVSDRVELREAARSFVKSVADFQRHQDRW
jgi:hypothetical protein